MALNEYSSIYTEQKWKRYTYAFGKNYGRKAYIYSKLLFFVKRNGLLTTCAVHVFRASESQKVEFSCVISNYFLEIK